MRAAVIAAEMEGRPTGVGRYLEGLLGGLASWDHGVEWHLFFQGAPWQGQPVGEGIVPHFSEDRGGRVMWEQARLARELSRHDLDVLFAPAYTLPFGIHLPSVVTIHDLSFEVLPGDFSRRERWRRRLLARRAARVADRVLADTGFMAEELGGRYAVPRDRLGIVPLGVDRDRFTREPEAGESEILAGLGVRRPYLLSLGTVFDRRLPQVVLEAFASLRRGRPELQLVIGGANRMRRPELFDRWVEGLEMEGAVLRLGWVEEICLAPLYRGAELGFYLSRHEGFGLPPLECLACGTPVVVSAGLALDDAWPEYPLRCPGVTSEEVVEKVETVLSDPEGRLRILDEASAVLGVFDWETSSRLLVAELQKALAS
ncbi:MAG: glycosyltransferase [Thermoanaerobaculales bacterium]